MSGSELVSLIDRLRAEANRGVREHMGYEHYVTTPVHGPETRALLRDAAMALAARLPGDDTARLDYIERTFGGCSNQERYLPLRMLWGKGCNGRTLREACDKYMARDASPTASPAAGIGEKL